MDIGRGQVGVARDVRMVGMIILKVWISGGGRKGCLEHLG